MNRKSSSQTAGPRLEGSGRPLEGVGAEAAAEPGQPPGTDRSAGPGAGRAAESPRGDRRCADRSGQERPGAGGLVGGAGGRGDRAGPGLQQGSAAGRDLADHLPRADERLAVAPRTIRVAYLGPKYSYSHLAAVATLRRGRRARARSARSPRSSRRSIAATSSSAWCRWRIRPTAAIADTLDMFIKLPNLKIRAEVRLRIHHCLMGRCEWGQVRRVYSKAQALSQCRNWLGKNVPQADQRRGGLDGHRRRAGPARGVRRRRRQPGRRRGVPAERPGREHRGPAAQRHPVRRHRRARRRAHRPRQDHADDPPVRTRPARWLRDHRPVREVRRQHDLDRVVPHARRRHATATPPTSSSSTSRGTSTTRRVQKALELVRKRCERLDILGSYPRSECIES